MGFYLGALNERIKLPDENDAIGIIICKSKKKTVVEYALKTAALSIKAYYRNDRLFWFRLVRLGIRRK